MPVPRIPVPLSLRRFGATESYPGLVPGTHLYLFRECLMYFSPKEKGFFPLYPQAVPPGAGVSPFVYSGSHRPAQPFALLLPSSICHFEPCISITRPVARHYTAS